MLMTLKITERVMCHVAGVECDLGGTIKVGKIIRNWKQRCISSYSRTIFIFKGLYVKYSIYVYRNTDKCCTLSFRIMRRALGFDTEGGLANKH